MRSSAIRCLLAAVLLAACAASAAAVPQVRIKDIATVSGLRSNQLLGIGLVTGLAGKGDSATSVLLQSTLSSLVSSFGVSVAAQDLRSRNCAVVMASAELPAFARSGDRLDVTVSSVGDARDLEGGVLLQSALLAANGGTYAVAQGRVTVATDPSGARTTGIVTAGAQVERGASSTFVEGGQVSILLRNPDFVTAAAVQAAVAAAFAGAAVSAPDPSRVQVTIPSDRQADPVGFIAQLEALTVTPDVSARVVIDASNGIIVVGEKVRIGKVAVSYRGTRVTVGSSTSSGTTGTTYSSTSASSGTATAGQGEPFVIPDTATVDDFVSTLKAAGLKADVIIGILQAIERAGALFGTLEIM